MIGHVIGSRLRCDDPNNLLGFILLGMIYLPCPPMSHSKRELDITILLPGRGRGRFSRKKPKELEPTNSLFFYPPRLLRHLNPFPEEVHLGCPLVETKEFIFSLRSRDRE